MQRWGTIVGSIFRDSTYGKLLRAPFDANAGPNEAHLSSGDSGGAVFVFNNSTNRWEFAGVNLAVDSPFSISAAGSNPFNAAMFDTTGLFVKSDQGNWITAPNPSAFYASEIAARSLQLFPFLRGDARQGGHDVGARFPAILEPA